MTGGYHLALGPAQSVNLANALVDPLRRLRTGLGRFVVAVGVSLFWCSASCWAQGSTDLVLSSTALTSGSTLYQAPNLITNAATFTVAGSASATFTAGNIIKLESGFDAVASGSILAFHAVIDPTVQSQPISITSSGGSGAGGGSSPNLVKEYIYLNGKPIVIERSQ